MDEEKPASSSTSEADEPAGDLPSVLIDVNENLRRELDEETKSHKQSSSSSHASRRSEEQTMSTGAINSTDPDKDTGATLSQRMHTHQPQENLRDTVFLRAEAIPENQMKVSICSQKQQPLLKFHFWTEQMMGRDIEFELSVHYFCLQK